MLKACCPVVFDRRLHEVEKERQEEIARNRERCEHGTILNLNNPSAIPVQGDRSMKGINKSRVLISGQGWTSYRTVATGDISMHLHTDSEIEQWVLRELSLHEKIRTREICVLARDGVLRLQGSTQSFSDRLAVEEATRGAPGVVSVVNDMKVKVPTGLIAERSATSAFAVPRSAHLRAQIQSQ